MKHVSLLTLLLLASACTHTGFAPTTTLKKYPVVKPAAQIEVYRTQLPTRKFIEIGSVNVVSGISTETMVQKLKEKAAENGGEALIGLEPYAGGMSATVIRFAN